MYRTSPQALLSLIVTACLTHGFAAGPSIGIAMASGPFQIDRSDVKGNSTLFDGSEVTTSDASSKLRMNGGARLEVATDSQARVFSNRTVLERGGGQVEGPAAYSLEARTLRINTVASRAIARVRLDDAGTVLVSAVNGPVRVSTASGVLLANLAPGRSLRFQPQGAPSSAFEGSGCVLKKAGRFILVDTTTDQTFELRAGDLTSQEGNRVTVKGTALSSAQPMEGASKVILVQSVTEVGQGGCLATAAAVKADPPPGTRPVSQEPPAVVKEAKGPNKAVIAGVVIAGAAAVGIAVGLSSKSKSP